MRRILIVLLCLTGLVPAAGAAARPGPPAIAAPGLVSPDLVSAFRGLAIGRGRLVSRMIGLDRGFIVWTRGRESGDVFILDQRFLFDDGETDRRIWRFRRTGPDSYVGERQDLAAPARLRIERGRIRLSYDIWLKRRGGKPLRLHCEDVITRLASGALLSRGTIYRLGVPAGRVETHLIPDAGRQGFAPGAPR